MDPFTIAQLALGGASLVSGLFGTKQENPNKWALEVAQNYQKTADTFLDPNNPFYQTAQRGFYDNLSKTLGANTPGTNDLLAMQMARGGSYGGSSYIANKQRESIVAKNRDTASTASEQFGTNLYRQGLGAYENLQGLAANMYQIYGRGSEVQNETQNSFANNLISVGGGMLSRYFTNQGDNSFGEGVDASFDSYMAGRYRTPTINGSVPAPRYMGGF